MYNTKELVEKVIENVKEIIKIKGETESSFLDINTRLAKKAEEEDLKMTNVDVANLNHLKATREELDVERKRIDSFVKLSQGSTTGDAELIDGRIDNEGIIHQTLGAGLRSKTENIESLITNGTKREYYNWETGSLNSTNGTLIMQATSYMSSVDFIPSDYSSLIIEPLNGFAVCVAQYDENKAFVSRSAYSKTKQNFKLTEAYYKISFGLVEAGSRDVTVDDVSNFLITKKVDTFAKRNLEAMLKSFSDGFYQDKVEYEGWTTGAIDGSGNGNSVPSYIRSFDFLSENIGTTLNLECIAPFVVAVAQYDENKTFVNRTTYETIQNVTISQPYFKISFGLTDGVTNVFVDDLDKLTINKIVKIKTSENSASGRLVGKTVYSFGDSLLYGHFSGLGMLDGLVSENGMTYNKYAINGAEVIQNIINQIYNASTFTPDFIVLDGMVNDAQYDLTSKLGSLTPLDDFSDPVDQTTFYGSLEHIFYTLRDKYLDSKIIYVIPHLMPTRPVDRQKILADAIIKTCKKWAIPVVNIQEEGQINTCIDDMRIKYSYNNAGEISNGNGTHLTGSGYDKWYKPMIVAKMLELI